MNSELLFPIPRIAQQQIKIKKCYSYNPSYYYFMLFFASGFTTTIQQDRSSFACQQSAPRPVRQTDRHPFTIQPTTPKDEPQRDRSSDFSAFFSIPRIPRLLNHRSNVMRKLRRCEVVYKETCTFSYYPYHG